MERKPPSGLVDRNAGAVVADADGAGVSVNLDADAPQFFVGN